MRSLRFLIVEDHEFQRAMLERALLEIGAQNIHAVSNGAQAMRALHDADVPFDIVVTDLMMPDVDGIELIELLRSSASEVPVILTSAAEQSLSAAVAIAQGGGVRVLGSIAKPVTPGKLRAVLEPYLAQRDGETTS